MRTAPYRFANLLGVTFSCLLAVMPVSAESNAATPPEQPNWGLLDSIVQIGIDAEVFPGAVLVVGSPDEIYHQKAYGFFTYEDEAAAKKLRADRRKRSRAGEELLPLEQEEAEQGIGRVTLDTMYDCASVTKVAATGMASLLMIEDGKVDLEAPVSTYIDGFDAEGKDGVRVVDLMTHTSGLKAYESWKKVAEARGEDELNADAMIRNHASLPLSYETGKGYRYSCLNFQTMARVSENASGERMEDLLRERIWEPLGMTNTAYVLTEEQLKNTAPTQELDNDDSRIVSVATGSVLRGVTHDPIARYHGSQEHCPGNAGLFASAPDLARLCAMLLNGGELDGARIFKEETLKQAMQSQTPEEVNERRGLAFDVYETAPYTTSLHGYGSESVVGHSGYTGTLIWLDQRTKTYMVFLTNRVFPDDSARSKAGISSVRKALCAAILRQWPEYREVMDQK